jgi:hypothetical protein
MNSMAIESCHLIEPRQALPQMNRLLRPASMLCVAALLSAAQSGSQSGAPPENKVEDLPPEIRALVPPGAVLSGPPVSDGQAVFDSPRPVATQLPPESMPLAADAVVASETMQLLPLHSRLVRPVAVGSPFNASHPAGTDVAHVVKNGVIRDCIRHRGTFTPPEDEHGEIFPGLCLEDRDRDGRFETAILLPYHPERAQERIVGIAPVRLEPNLNAMQDDPDALTVKRRIRVTLVSADAAEIVVEQGFATSRQTEVTSFYSRPEDSLHLALRDGESGSLGGVEFRLRHDVDFWRIAATGRFAPWLEVRENGNLIVAGGMEFRRRPSTYR